MRQIRYTHVAAFLLLIAAYVGLRLWRLTDSCLWFDEIFSVHAAEHSWNSLFNFVALDLIHPPLFYVLLKFWFSVGGESVFSLRLLPVVFSIIAIVPFIALCRELKLTFWTQALALFLLAVNGSLIKYAQEVRMYSLLMCLSLFSMWLFVRYFNRGKNFTALVIVNVLMIYTHYFGWFVVVSEVVLILWFQRTKWRRILTMFGIVFASFLPWMIAIWQAARSGSELGQNIGWMTRPGVREIGTFVFDLIEPLYSQATTSEPTSIYRVSVPILLIVVVSWITYLFGWKGRTDDERRAIWLLLVFIKLPIIFAFIASWLLPYSIWGTRHLIIIFAPLTILIVIGVANIPVQWLRIASVTLLLLFSGYAAGLQTGRRQFHSWCGVEPLVTEALENERLNIYTTEDLFAYHAWFAGRNSFDETAKVIKLNALDVSAEDRAFFLPRGFDGVEHVKLAEIREQKLWLLYRSDGFMPDEPPIRNFTAAGYFVKSNKAVVMKDGAAILAQLEK